MIGDSKCGASHKAAQEHNANLTDRAHAGLHQVGR
jgi:hypothetical protein